MSFGTILLGYVHKLMIQKNKKIQDNGHQPPSIIQSSNNVLTTPTLSDPLQTPEPHNLL